MSLLRTRPTLTALLALLCLSGGLLGGLPAEPAAADGTAVRVIRQHYKQINTRVARCRRVEKELQGYSLEGGELTAFFDGDTLLKLELTFLGESGRAAEAYYYWDGQLIFIDRADSNYGAPLSGKVVRTQKSRGYFRDGAMISWIDVDGQPMPLGSRQYQDKQKECLQYSKEFSQAARSPEPEVQAAHYR